MSLPAILRDIATMACITALALGHVIPGSTAVALLAPYLALRALLSYRKPPPGGGASSGEDECPPNLPSGAKPRRHVRILLDLLPFMAAPASLVIPFALPDLEQLLAAVDQLRELGRHAFDRAEVLLWQARGAVYMAFRPARRA